MAPSKLREYFKVDYRPGERALVQKVDFFILTFCCLSYFMNYVSDPSSSCHVLVVARESDIPSSTAPTWPMPTYLA